MFIWGAIVTDVRQTWNVWIPTSHKCLQVALSGSTHVDSLVLNLVEFVLFSLPFALIIFLCMVFSFQSKN